MMVVFRYHCRMRHETGDSGFWTLRPPPSCGILAAEVALVATKLDDSGIRRVDGLVEMAQQLATIRFAILDTADRMPSLGLRSHQGGTITTRGMGNHMVDIAEALRNTDLFRNFRNNFRRLTGFTIFLTDPAAAGAPPAQISSRFCRLLGQSGVACDACCRFHRTLVRDARRAPRTVRCFAGVSYTAIPVVAEDRPVALMEFGPVALCPRDPGRFDRLTGRPPLDCLPRNHHRLRNAWAATATISAARHRAIVGLLDGFSRQLGDLANHLVLHARQGEPDIVARARRFIDAHSCEEISLTEVARAAHVSAGYLSELFHKTTHDTFTHYVARLRVEESKQLLLGSGKRVTEIAYEVGFQSLSQFNRVFKEITGKTPSQFRSAVA